jgi:hypothetical protein
MTEPAYNHIAHYIPFKKKHKGPRYNPMWPLLFIVPFMLFLIVRDILPGVPRILWRMIKHWNDPPEPKQTPTEWIVK